MSVRALILLPAILLVVACTSREATAYLGHANDLANKGDYEQAIADYNKAIELDPSHASVAFYDRGLAWERKGDYRQAIADFDRVIDIDPRDVQAYVSRADVWKKLGNSERARADRAKAAELLR